MEFTDWASDEAVRSLPGIREMDAGANAVVLADDGAWWQGDATWLTCLWATRQYRPWAHRLASPALRPLLRRIVAVISENRLTFSRLFHMTADAPLAGMIRAETTDGCKDGTCRATARPDGS